MESRDDAITLDRVLVALDELDQSARCVGVVLPCPPLWQGKFMTNHECFKRLVDGQAQQDVCVSLWLTHVVSFLFLLMKSTPTRDLEGLRIIAEIIDLLDKYTVFKKSVKNVFKSSEIALR